MNDEIIIHKLRYTTLKYGILQYGLRKYNEGLLTGFFIGLILGGCTAGTIGYLFSKF